MIRWCSLILGLVSWGSACAAEAVDYTHDVKPILLKHCVSCHGPQKQKSGLRLDTAAMILRGGDSGAVIVPGDATKGRLLDAITGKGDASPMPPKGDRLTAAEIATIRSWIASGAKAPQAEAVTAATAKSDHWAFQPVRALVPPTVRDRAWGRNPVDRFILAKLEAMKIAPSKEADRTTLIRRLHLDLIGLPPSPEEVDAFLRDEASDAYERVVDRLLTSPHYGERWGRLWLDAARYADSNGYSIDAARSIWPWRDWVIRSLNRDLPFDQFVIAQMAGDLLPNADLETRTATGFHRNTPINQEGGIDLEQFRTDSIYDRVNTVGGVMLGLTVGCAQCHDHKFDPLTQREYYQLFAFMNNDDEPTLELAAPHQVALKKKLSTERTAIEKRFKQLDRATDANLEKWERSLTNETRATLPADIQFILNIAVNGRDEKQVETLRTAFRRADQTRHVLGGLAAPVPLSTVAHVQVLNSRLQMEKRLAELKQAEPPVPTTMVLRQRATPRTTHIHLGGDFLRKGVAVEPKTPAWLPPSAGKSRLDFGRWLVDSSNPLSPRVLVNRLWQAHFGVGLVETENDFGTQGTPPSHPELLDWLAHELVRSGWSMKEIHRLMVCSATYRQSSGARPDLSVVDPRNKLLARMPRIRLEAELVRDAALAVSGKLNRKVGGPSVFPPQPEGVFKFTQVPRSWKADTGPDRHRRGLYIHFWRSAPHPALSAFDAPDGINTCTRRNRSNTPLQALTLLNDEGFVELASALSERVAHEVGSDEGRIERLFRLCLSRMPRAHEKVRLASVLNQVRQSGSEQEAWLALCRVCMNLDEFITRE